MKFFLICSGRSIVDNRDFIVKEIGNDSVSIGVHSAICAISTTYALVASNYCYKKYKTEMIEHGNIIAIPHVAKKMKIKPKHVINLWTFLPVEHGFLRIIGDKVIGANITAGVLGIASAYLFGAKEVLVAGMDGLSGGHCDGSNFLECKDNLMKYERANMQILSDLKRYVKIKFITESIYGDAV